MVMFCKTAVKNTSRKIEEGVEKDMGSHIQFGIAKRMRIKKTENWKEILERIQQTVGKDFYRVRMRGKEMVLTLKDTVIEKYLVDFIEEQAMQCDSHTRSCILKETSMLKGKKYTDMVEEFDIGDHKLLQLSNYWADVSYLDPEQQAEIDVEERIVYVIGGRTYIDNYAEIFTYLRNAIIASSQNPIRTALVLTMD